MKPWAQVVASAEQQAQGEAHEHQRMLDRHHGELCAEDRALLCGLARRLRHVAAWCSKRLERME